jgi:DNA-binding transcriptional MerR regulator
MALAICYSGFMGITQANLENADILAAAGVTVATIQTWANRGILALSETQQNPGPGQKRLYSRLDAARIAVIQSLTASGLAANAAGQIARRLERGPYKTTWHNAIEETAGHIHVFIDGPDVIDVYPGNDMKELARRLTAIAEPTQGGTIGRGVQDFTEKKKNVAVFDVGPHVSSALRKIAERHGSFVAKAEITNPNLALSQPLVLKEDEGRFIWCGLIPEPPLAADSEEAARKELENWASKFPGSKVEW